ncbi:conserved hypothetical protein [Cellulomonas flavigena DSM 20109]|uniref:DUF1361 domain-containing protein n=1 Tax=Cellulomonas flavigena (strain ATCC 482 / DSM 20109 / BCRC 11376 / JCM 18109 / NBRC 3775 / NCIMB 8073 / NRS 134) TaxID=446466 RepID=D5UFS9_CELFN|nr:DUF1361 domain-containing protein [Cellulomonas flavigena]ADG73038.1 conserved hypothetical protein [Cellulomonas flavigena DSM 20109]
MLNSLIVGVVLLNVLAAALVVARAPVYRTRLYRPMLLNLVLSAAPLVVLGLAVVVLLPLLVVGTPRPVVWGIAGALGLVWLLLLPNSGYLITELNLNHRRAGERVPEWYDVLLVLSLAMAGVATTVLNVFLVVLLGLLATGDDSAAALAQPWARAVETVLLVLVAFGIYLGRHVRLNSWDVRHPRHLVRKVVGHLRSRGAMGNALGFTLVGALFLGLMYLVMIGPVVTGLVEVERLRG